MEEQQELYAILEMAYPILCQFSKDFLLLLVYANQRLPADKSLTTYKGFLSPLMVLIETLITSER